MKNVLLSVIITTYKRSDSLERAIDSVLNQDGSFEVIVVDDNDENSEYRIINEQKLSKYLSLDNFKYVKHIKNMNGAAARNSGIDVACGKYITFLDDDDEFVDGRIAKVTEVLELGYDFVCTGILFKRNSKIIDKLIPNISSDSIFDLQTKLLSQNSFIGTGSNIVCRKSLVDKIDGFDINFVRHQDIEFLIRYLGVCKKVSVIDDFLIVKNVDSCINFPNYKKMLSVKMLFLDKFKSDILLRTESDRKIIYRNNFNELMKSACSSFKISYIRECVSLSKNYGSFSIFNFISIFARQCIKRLAITLKLR